MKKTLLAGVIITALLAACSKDEDEYLSINATDRSFLSRVALNNRAAIIAGKLADSLSGDAMVRAYAQKVFASYDTIQNGLISIARDAGYPVGDSIDTVQRAYITKLRTLTGRVFDSVYLKGQVSSQQETRNLFNAEISTGQQKYIKAFASRYQATIQNHYNTADSIYNVLF
jgi:predicted outer membrane protein